MRSSIVCLAIISFVFTGCSAAPPEENVSTENESALTSSCTSDIACDPTLTENGIEFSLSHFDSTTLTLTGVNSKGAFTANFVATTAFRQANLNNYPNDPCRTAAAQYNTISASGSSDSLFTGPITSLASGCTAQVWLTNDGTSIRAFRPKAP